MNGLGSNLFSEIAPKFFGILTGPNAKVYLDVMDLLDRESPQRGNAFERAEALEIIDSVLAKGLSLQAEGEEELSDPAEVSHPSSLILRRLIHSGWLEEEKRADYQRFVFIEPIAQTLLEALRSIMSQNVASFTGKLRLVCDMLSQLTNPAYRMELVWEQFNAALADTRAGLRELRLIRRQVERYAQRQLTVGTISEALDLIYTEFSQLITQRCYRELIHARLPERLRDAITGLTDLERDDEALAKLCEQYMRTRPEATEADAMRAIRQVLEELPVVLGDVEPTADRVDLGTSEFARRSRARIRYIQDVGSARRQQIKSIFDYVRDHLPEERLSDISLDLPALRIVDQGLIGMASLARSRRLPDLGERRPVIDALSDADREQSLREMERNLRNALRLDRANKFVERLNLEPGERIASGKLSLPTEDDLLDVISTLVFASAGGANYELETLRDRNPAAPITHDTKGGFHIERFELEKK